MTRPSLEDELAEKVMPEPNSGCWIWMLSLSAAGYGYAHCPIEKKGKKAHRYIWERKNGPIPRGMSVLHKCDNRCCVNPDHLFLGSQDDNMKDMWRKKRHKYYSSSKLTIEQVREIFVRDDVSYNTIAREYGINRFAVRDIKLRRTWFSATEDLVKGDSTLSAPERIALLESIIKDTLWMARRYAHGRQSYAVGLYNDAAKKALQLGIASPADPDGSIFAIDGPGSPGMSSLSSEVFRGAVAALEARGITPCNFVRSEIEVGR